MKAEVRVLVSYYVFFETRRRYYADEFLRNGFLPHTASGLISYLYMVEGRIRGSILMMEEIGFCLSVDEEIADVMSYLQHGRRAFLLPPLQFSVERECEIVDGWNRDRGRLLRLRLRRSLFSSFLPTKAVATESLVRSYARRLDEIDEDDDALPPISEMTRWCLAQQKRPREGDEEEEDGMPPRKGVRAHLCNQCGWRGHNRRTCHEEWRSLREGKDPISPERIEEMKEQGRLALAQKTSELKTKIAWRARQNYHRVRGTDLRSAA